jgi:hypothetical protein
MRQHSLAALLLLVAACSEGTSRPVRQATPQPVATNTGAFAVVAVGGTLKAYVPGGMDANGHFQLVVVDAAHATNATSGHLGAVDLGTLDGDAEAVGAVDGLVIAISFGTPNLWFIDPVTDTVTKHMKLPDGYGSWDVSNRNAFMSGVAMDPVRRRAYISVWSGFIVVDLDTQQFVDSILVAPSENFGFDPQRNRLIAPFYLCPDPSAGTSPPPPCTSYLAPDGVTVITHGINVVDLQSSKVYTYVDPAAPDQSKPAGDSPDAAAMDPVGGFALVPVEIPSEVLMLNLGTATFNPNGTFTASAVRLAVPPETTGVAIEPGSRLGVGSQEADARVMFYDLDTITADVEPPQAIMPDLPWGAGPWLGHSDPHNIRAGVIDGKPVAWLLSRSHYWLARIDLEKLKQLAEATPAVTGPTVIEQADMATATTYIFVGPSP